MLTISGPTGGARHVGDGVGCGGVTEEQYDGEQPAAAHRIGERTYFIADVEPLDVDGVRTLVVGTALWAIAFLALLPFYGQLREDGRGWVLWTCLAGFGLGLFGWEYCRRRARKDGDATG